MELFEKVRLIIKSSRFVFFTTVVYTIFLIMYSTITIINNQLRSENVFVTSDGEIVINGIVRSLPTWLLLFSQICLIISITLMFLSMALSISIFMRLKKSIKHDDNNNHFYGILITYSLLSIIFFGFLFSLLLWIKSVKESKKLDDYNSYIASLDLDESEHDNDNSCIFSKVDKSENDAEKETINNEN